MAVAKAEILDAIANMTVLELSQLIKEMEEKSYNLTLENSSGLLVLQIQRFHPSLVLDEI